MPTTITTTIGSSHTDTTVQAWVTSLNGLNLVAANQIQEGACYNDSEFAVAGLVADYSGSTFTVDATRYSILDTGAGQSFRDNASVRSNALYYNAANGVGLRNTGTGLYTIDARHDFIHISNLQVKGDAGTRAPLIVGGNTGATSIVNNCIFVGGELEVDGPTTFNNCLFVNTIGPFSRVADFQTTDTSTFNNCGFIANPSLANYFNFDAAATVNCVACYFFGGGTSAFSAGSGTVNFTSCMTDITGTTGLTGGVAFSASTGSKFQSITNDFRVQAGSSLIGVGGAPGSGVLATDISGVTRPNPQTIGPWEVAGAPAHRLTTLGAGFLMPRVGLLPGALAYGAKRLIDNPRLSRRGFIKGWRP